ncbi:hypothetical protein ACROYT_G022347 [Oculina patagonica]
MHEQHKHARNASSLENLCIGYSVLPLDVQEASETAEMEAVEPLLLRGVGCPEEYVQKSAEDTGLVDTKLGIYRQLAFLPDALAELGHNCSGLGNPGADFCIKEEGAGHCEAQAWDRRLTRSWSPASVWDVSAALSANRSSRIRTSMALVLARRRATLYSFPSALVRM